MQTIQSGAMRLVAALSFGLIATAAVAKAADDPQAGLRGVVDAAVQPVIEKYRIPGMSVGITVAGKSYVFNYGVASTQTRQPVTRDTLFELGSVSKTFTSTLASWAQLTGELSLSDTTAKYLPSLQGSQFGGVKLLNLGTHTPGGLPLQVPDDVQSNDQLMQYFKAWQPAYAPGTHRTYSNVGIGTLGLITAKSMGQDFDSLMQQRLFPALGMSSTYIKVPAASMADYAQGYAKDDTPVRMSAGMLSSEAYGIKSSAADMIRFMQANMGLLKLDGTLQRALTETHTGYFNAAPMTQDLIWEQYPYPVALKALLEGNSYAMIYHPTPVTPIQPPLRPRKDVWINKTGSTDGFGAYIAFVPEARLGIVILANRNYPNDDRVTAAYKILTSLADRQQAKEESHE